jgi:hypothetical protein
VNLESLQVRALEYLELLKGWLASPQFYAQVLAIIGLWIVAKIIARQIATRVPMFSWD